MNPSRHARLAIGDLLDILPDAVVMVDAAGRISYVNPALRTVLGYEPLQLIDQPLSVLVPPASREAHERSVALFRKEGVPTMMGSRPVLHAVHRSGRLVAVSISLCNLTLSNDERVSVAVIHDVSALHTDLDRATAQAETDALTGLGNRVRLARRMRALVGGGAITFGLLFLDLERFKLLNDRHGHAVGDEALRVVSRRLQSLVRDGDLVTRQGGDEFVLLFDGIGSVPDARMGVNVGGAIFPRHGATTEALLRAADAAMYAAKQSRRIYRLADATPP